jgi:drug/metabolite transporter (DMT)-like permease
MLRRLQRAMERLYRTPSLLLTVAAVFWGGNTVAGRLAVDQIPPLMLVFLRWVLVIGVLWPIYGARVRAQWRAARPGLARLLTTSLLGFTGFNALYYIAAHYTSAINLGILQGAMPVFVLLGALFAHGTRIAPVQLSGVLMTVLGVVVVATRGAPQSILGLAWNAGDLAMLGACALYAGYTVALSGRPAMSGIAYFTLLGLVASLTSLPLAVLEALLGGLRPPTLQGLMVTAYVAAFPSCIAQLFYLRGVDLIGPGRAGVFINLVPVISAVLAMVLLEEPFQPYHGLALVLVVGGIWLAQRAPATRASDAR